METWKDVAGFNGEYMVSDHGNVRSNKNRRKAKLLKPYVLKNGYLQVVFFHNKKFHCFRVHRLVAETFIPNPDGKPQVNHKDGNKLNNAVSNLEWVTGSENQKHAYKTGLMPFRGGFRGKGENNPNAKLTNDQARTIRSIYKPRSTEFGARALGRKYGVNNATILAIVKGERYLED